jgi:hypothetical protein
MKTILQWAPSNHFAGVYIMRPRLLRLGISLLLFCGLRLIAAQQLTLVQEGKSPYVIMLSAEASPSENRGAQEIQAHLQKMSGVQLPIVAADAAAPQRAILVGRGRHLDGLGLQVDWKALGEEGFILKTVGENLVIAGSAVRGTMYGCYEFLERLGVRWFSPKVTRVPQRQTVEVPFMDEIQVPAFEYREPFFTEAQDRDWAARNKINGSAANLDDSTGGRVTYYHFVHTFDDLIPAKLYETHPEYFPLRDGKRVNGYVQRCLTNPDVLKLAISGVLQWIREQPGAMIYSVSQNDTGKWCECGRCKALTEKYGAHSGLYLWFVNQVAEAVEKEHPDKLIDTLAYQFTETPPSGIVPRANVRVRLCPISCCEAHPYQKCRAKQNVAFLAHLRAWSKITDTLYIWHYNTNFSNYLLPFPDFGEFPAEVRLYKQSGVKGVFFQGDYAPGGGGSDAELRSYVMAKLLWKENVDSNALVTEWMQGVYGKAWKPMRAWFDLLHRGVRGPGRHFYIYSKPNVEYLSAGVLAAGDRLFDRAENLSSGDLTASEYVTKSRLWLRYAKIARRPRTGPEFEKFMSDVRKLGITQLREGQSLEAWEKAYLERTRGRKSSR